MARKQKVDWVVLRNGDGVKDRRTHYAKCLRCDREYDLTDFFPMSLEALQPLTRALTVEHQYCQEKG